MKNKPHYSRKSEIALAWSVTWLIAMVVMAFLAVTRFRGDNEWFSGSIFALFSLLSAIGFYYQGREASRCQRIHLSRTSNQ